MELRTICEALKSNAAPIAVKIIERWGDVTAAETWLALPDDLDFDHLPELIRDLAAASLCTEFERSLCRTLVDTAATHGSHRAEQGFGDTLIYREYHLLRRAIWERMKEHFGENANTYYASMRLDAAASLATAAALHGMHRQELEAQGKWPEILGELLKFWPLPGG